MIRDDIINIYEETVQEVMCRFITRVYLCTQEGGGHLKALYTKSETMQKQFNHNSKLCVLKLILITVFSGL